MSIKLPISKSIANRILLLQAIHGDPLMRVSSDMPDDVIVLHDALEALRNHQPGEPLTLYLKNCGTALRFLQVHLDKCYPGEPVTLTGDPRLMERNGKPTSQTNSALLMHGVETDDSSPYVEMTRRVMATYPDVRIERDWSAAAFWYEYTAVHGGRLELEGLTPDSIQGDRIVSDIYAAHFGVSTTFTPSGALLKKEQNPSEHVVILDFTATPDLFPSVALTCERLGMELRATGTERLRYKESDRIEAVRFHEVRNDHRIAMALMAADFSLSDADQACIVKSYPDFAEQLRQITCDSRRSNDDQTTVKAKTEPLSIEHITPIKGVNDDNLGKKHALSKLIHAAGSDFVWLHDDDVVWPIATDNGFAPRFSAFDLIILPLRMVSEHEKPSLLERLQIAEYAAIQELTMRTAKKGKAVMCSGANLIVRRKAWLACESELHPEIPSGDDMFLLEAMKRHGLSVGVIDEPEYTAVVRPLTSWRAFFRQRMRWAGKAPHYTDRDIRRCGALVATANILQLLCLPVLLIKFPVEYRLIKKREPQTSWPVALLLAVLYPVYLLVCLIGGLFRKKW